MGIVRAHKGSIIISINYSSPSPLVVAFIMMSFLEHVYDGGGSTAGRQAGCESGNGGQIVQGKENGGSRGYKLC